MPKLLEDAPALGPSGPANALTQPRTFYPTRLLLVETLNREQGMFLSTISLSGKPGWD